MKKESSRPWGFNDLMVVAAFRYCLGRRTYIVGVCADWLIAQWPNFSDSTKDLIQRELEEEIKRDNVAREKRDDYKPLGHDCDRAEWERVRGLWRPARDETSTDQIGNNMKNGKKSEFKRTLQLTKKK